MKRIEPELNKIKKEFPDKQEQAKKTFELYKQHKIHPLSGCLPILIQFPVVIALYWAIRSFSVTPDASLLYPWVHPPQILHNGFLGISVTEKSIILAIIVALVQYFQISLSQKNLPKNTTKNEDLGTQQQMMKSMQSQMKYTMPIMIGFFTYGLPAAIGIYWLFNLLTTIVQEYYIRKQYGKYNDSRN